MSATFAPPRNPQWPLDTPITPRLLLPGFGDGDPIFAPDGINTMLHQQITLKFVALTQAQFTAIDSFLTANLNLPFFYTLPDETTARLWTYAARTRRMLATTWQYEVTLKEQPVL